VSRDLNLSLGDRYINGNSQFQNSNLVSLGGYYRFNDNWAFSFGELYEFQTKILEAQSYQVSRDLSSWVASFGFTLQNNGSGQENLGVVLTFTLKDLPNVRLPMAFSPSSIPGLSGTK